MIGIQIACDGQEIFTAGTRCPLLHVDAHICLTELLAPQIEACVTEQGWSVEQPTPETTWTEPRYYCPLHNPTLRGELYQLGADRYLHLGNGVYARLNPDQPAAWARIDVQVRQPPAEAAEPQP